ncbi:MAG TPA: DUF4178 domain-containing protein [Candidatus Binatia bacterium]|nr:DUF4178 domain-containing protein [Candidatus Binatia bacterium]
MSFEANCPACGAKVVFRGSASVVAVCEYCRSTLVRHDVNLEDVGKMADLKADGSPLQLGSSGAYRGVRFAVAGRIQYRFEQGLWNEWYLVFDDMRAGWLGEARGSYAISFPTDVTEALPPFAELRAGQTLMIGGRSFEVVDVQYACTIAGEGELPFRVGTGYRAPVADLHGRGRSFATLDYSDDPPLVFLGEYVEFDDLALSGLRTLNGW